MPLNALVQRCRALRETLQPQVKALAASGFRRYITLGGSCFTGPAEEASLKMLELTAGRIVTRYDSPLGLRHGPKFMVDGQTLVVVMFSHDDYARQYDRDLWNELQRDGLVMQLVGLTGEPGHRAMPCCLCTGPRTTSGCCSRICCSPRCWPSRVRWRWD